MTRAHVAILLTTCLLWSGAPRAGQGARAAQSSSSTPGLTSLHVQGHVWVIAGAGGNITVQVSDATATGPGAGEGVLLVDTGRQDVSRAVLAQIQRISTRRIEYIIHTHADADHVGGNELFVKPRMDFLATPGTITGPGVKVIAHENVLPRMSTGATTYPSTTWPTYTYSATQRKIYPEYRSRLRATRLTAAEAR